LILGSFIVGGSIFVVESFSDAAIMRVSRRRFPRTVKCRFRGESANGQTATSHDETVAASAALVDARRDFAEELEKLRSTLLQNEQRLAAAERRALLEIEGERVAAAEARKTLAAAAEKNAAEESAHRLERDTLRDDVSNLRAQLNGSTARSKELHASIEAKDKLLAEQTSVIETLRLQIGAITQKLETAQASSGAVRPPRHPNNKGGRARRRQVDFSTGPFIIRTDASS
jgi:chromosome segregation ATPase